MPRRQALGAILLELEAQLRNQQLWSITAPSAEQLASRMPFAVDTLSFERWLQFMLLPKMHALLRSELPLPAACAIAPAAEVSFAGCLAQRQTLLQILIRFDAVFTAL